MINIKQGIIGVLSLINEMESKGKIKQTAIKMVSSKDMEIVVCSNNKLQSLIDIETAFHLRPSLRELCNVFTRRDNKINIAVNNIETIRIKVLSPEEFESIRYRPEV